MFSMYFSGQRPMRPSKGCQLRWEQVNLCQMLESGEFICKDTQPPRKCAVLAWIGKGQHTGWKQTISGLDLLCLLMIFPVKSLYSLRWSKVYVVKTAHCWRTWQIPPVHLFWSCHPLENKGPRSHAFIDLAKMFQKPQHSRHGARQWGNNTEHNAYGFSGVRIWVGITTLTTQWHNIDILQLCYTGEPFQWRFLLPETLSTQFRRHLGSHQTKKKGNTLDSETIVCSEAQKWEKIWLDMWEEPRGSQYGREQRKEESWGWGWRSSGGQNGGLVGHRRVHHIWGRFTSLGTLSWRCNSMDLHLWAPQACLVPTPVLPRQDH